MSFVVSSSVVAISDDDHFSFLILLVLFEVAVAVSYASTLVPHDDYPVAMTVSVVIVVVISATIISATAEGKPKDKGKGCYEGRSSASFCIHKSLVYVRVVKSMSARAFVGYLRLGLLPPVDLEGVVVVLCVVVVVVRDSVGVEGVIVRVSVRVCVGVLQREFTSEFDVVGVLWRTVPALRVTVLP